MSEKARKKAKDLIALAADTSTSEKERVAAALQAARIIKKYKLLDSVMDMLPSDGIVQDAKTVLDTVTNPDFLGSLKKIGGELKKFRRR